MSLTADQITPGVTYLVRCHGKDFGRQVAQLQAIADWHRVNPAKETNATFDPERKLWVVRLAAAVGEANLIRFRGAIHVGAEVVRAGDLIGPSDEPEPEPQQSDAWLDDPTSDLDGAPDHRSREDRDRDNDHDVNQNRRAHEESERRALAEDMGDYSHYQG